MSVSIIEVKTKVEEKTFIDLPWRLYENDSSWVPPLKLTLKGLFKKDHPFYAHSKMKKWLALKGGRYVGRIAAIINTNHNQFHEEQAGFFGFFECTEDHEVAGLLFAKAESWLRSQGMNVIRGPVSPSTNYECGLLVEGFKDPPQIMMTYNKPYYGGLLENAGYEKAKDLFAYRLPCNFEFPDKLKNAAQRHEKSKRITWRNLKKSQWDREVDTMLQIYNDAWEKNWGFVPMDENEFRHMADELKHVAIEELIVFAEVNGDPAGFIIALPDYNQVFKHIPNGKLFPFGIFKLLRSKKYINRVRAITLGVKKKYRSLGLAPLLIQKAQQNVMDTKRYTEAEQGWVLEDNEAMNRPLELIGAERYKKYRIFEKKLKDREIDQ